MEDKQFLVHLGEQIAKQRKKQSLSQQELAYINEIEKPSITRIEKGRTNPSSLTLLKISKALGIPISKFFSFQSTDLKESKKP
jgi:transcriptional regulator with XRE-family HTH domain